MDSVMVPRDDSARSYSDSLLPLEMIYAGMAALDQADSEMANYVPGETTDWDQGMMAVAVYRAMIAAAPPPPAEAPALGVEDVARIIDPEAFDPTDVHPQHMTKRRRSATAKAQVILAAMERAGE